ncbi:hypothetical protein KY284_032758 [Solanum tuberosum]|nr:hypothetical protein KY284_032758 [Solanum tuberosum]
MEKERKLEKERGHTQRERQRAQIKSFEGKYAGQQFLKAKRENRSVVQPLFPMKQRYEGKRINRLRLLSKERRRKSICHKPKKS